MTEVELKSFKRICLEDFVVGAIAVGGVDALFPDPSDGTLLNTIGEGFLAAVPWALIRLENFKYIPPAVHSGMVAYSGALAGQTFYQIVSNYLV